MKQPQFLTSKWLLDLLSGEMITETIWETWEEELADVGESLADESDPVSVTVLEPEGCMEILCGDRRFHIIVQEVDEHGEPIG